MEEKERSVVERLESIENKISSPQEKPVFIDDIIGMPFSSYLKQSKIYGIEADERKFKHVIKRQTVAPILCLSFILVAVIIHAISFSINKDKEWMCLLADAFASITPILILLILGNQKPKQPMKSFWNIKNLDFYLVPEGDHKRISSETKNGFWFFGLLFSKIFGILGSGAFAFIYFITSSNTAMNQALYWLSSVFGYLVFMSFVVCIITGKPYYFYHYIFETNDSYVTYPDLEYVKKNN